MSENQSSEFIRRIYNCAYCKRTHFIDLAKDLAENKPRYPFPHVFLHSSEGDLNDILTTLYLDAQLQIRGVEILKLENNDIFSESLTKKITEKLMDMIIRLEQENIELRGLLEKIDLTELGESEKELEDKDSSSKKKWRIYILSLIGGEERKDLLIEGNDLVEEVKKAAGDMFKFQPMNFHLSFEGLLLKQTSKISDYDIQNGDELVLIPARK